MSTRAKDHGEGGEDLYVSIPLGGPIHVPDSIGPPIRVADFETSVFQELQSLTEALSLDSMETFDEEISVGELKIIRKDELVNKAFEEAFKDGELTMDASQVKKVQLSPQVRETVDTGASDIELGSRQNLEGDMKALVTSDSSHVKPLKTCKGTNKGSEKEPPVKPLKRKRKNEKNNDFDESYLVKVEQLASIKQKQKQDKAAVRLHSFDGSKEPKHGANSKADRIKSLKSGSFSTKVRASNTSDNVPVHFPETVLSVEVYHNRNSSLKTQEFLVLGRQFLSELRDNIYCSTDKMMKKAGRHDPSGYFLIEDVFCNDMRESSAIDYSKPILDWLEESKTDALEKWEYILSGELQQKQKALLGSESKQKLPRFKSVRMQSTRFCDLMFRLGAGYLYCHQGDCKHIIVIRDMRLLHPEDVQSRSSYPLITIQLKRRHKKCSVCNIYRAQRMTMDDKWASSNPCYFCENCYYMLHYAEGPQLHGDLRPLLYPDFDVYDYLSE